MNLKACGFPAHLFSGHSFRKGGAQSLADAGVAPHVIKTMGRWASWCFALYIAMTRESMQDISRTMARHRSTHVDCAQPSVHRHGSWLQSPWHHCGRVQTPHHRARIQGACHRHHSQRARHGRQHEPHAR